MQRLIELLTFLVEAFEALFRRRSGTENPETSQETDLEAETPSETEADIDTAEPGAEDLPTESGISPISPKVLVVIFNPRVPSFENKPLTGALGWRDPDELLAGFIADIEQASHGLVTYRVAERMEVARFPSKQDGYCYDPESYLSCRREQTYHQPDGVDYDSILTEFDIINKVNSLAIDEVWLFGMPFAGFAESAMAGPGAYFCNGEPVSVNEPCARRFFIMGFNFERGVGEMLEAMGHRAESMIERAYRGKTGDANLWERFIRVEDSHPGRAEVGTVHLAPNSERDYDWANEKQVLSRCDTWYAFPDLRGDARLVGSTEWGGEVRAHHLWWLSHFPHIAGRSNGVFCNWWRYVLDANSVD